MKTAFMFYAVRVTDLEKNNDNVKGSLETDFYFFSLIPREHYTETSPSRYVDSSLLSQGRMTSHNLNSPNAPLAAAKLL